MKSFLDEVKSLSPDLPYHTAVRWLSCGKILTEIEILLNEKERSMEILSDKEWLWKLAFSADEKDIICDLYTHVKGFRQKLLLFEQQISQKTFAHFVCCQSLEREQDSEFPFCLLKKFLEQFPDRFSDLDAHFKAIRIFQNPLSCEIKNVQPSLQLELIDLQDNDIMKDKFKEGSLVQFYNFLPEENYPKIKDFARSFLYIFGTSYRCEQTFSLLKFTKSKCRDNLSDQHLRDILLIQQTENLKSGPRKQ
ncbi:hypothetical protein PR048_025526 [Dryococelus australis]|uniref:HAT C-terminal dimerisation domain-containing protein n=1 Tax=Dryococelus australis TaxID=614101 RepID=A0ABQ9GRH9_9NEOP|nr:hypothetical protein PR048_025526 [Dryococelus australis]